VKSTGIILFFLLLLAPAVLSVTGWMSEFQIEENRTRAAWPESGFTANPVGYFAAAQAWFDDHFGGRDFLIRLKTQIDYSFLNTSSRVHIGNDGWLFYRSVLDQQKPAMEHQLALNADSLDANIGRLALALKEHDIQLILMPIQLADIYYPKMLPHSVPNTTRPSRFALAVERWRHIPNVTVFDSDPTLRQIQATRPTFQKTDFHWNEPAAFEVAHAFVDMMGNREGLKQELWDHALSIEARPYSGKEAMFLPLFSTPSEDGLFIKQIWNEPDLHYVGGQGPYEWISTQTTQNHPLLPTVCAIGDSFFDGLSTAGLSAYFNKIYFVRWRTEATFYNLLQQLPPDCRYLLVEFIEVQSPAITGLTNASDALGFAAQPR
jgi:hypothetical protein